MRVRNVLLEQTFGGHAALGSLRDDEEAPWGPNQTSAKSVGSLGIEDQEMAGWTFVKSFPVSAAGSGSPLGLTA